MNEVPDRPSNAVALRYDGDGAPRVIAKGRGELAERIREVAREHDVPMHADRELVELLSRVDLGEEIPPELYLAVAQVLAFAYRISGRTAPTEDAGARQTTR
jgi:flagellar biosynthesis protein